MPAEEPLFRIVRGVPTAEELAALVGAIVVRTRPAQAAAPAPAGACARRGGPARSAAA
ncbi:acyl-CoA carboxylase epsilon subunit, partial [Micromonospora sp. NPDC005313]|uniref:acyl-CoA carboxylase epsilon subunit n=1 Tax=Micromonospora sp. NPDC005313 TaxID=3154296 RepID=UPI00339FB8C0